MRLSRQRASAVLASLAIVASTLAASLSSAPAAQAAEVPTGPLLSTAATTWTYLDDNSNPTGGTGAVKSWTQPGFVPSGAWKSAKGSFGAKNGTSTNLGNGFVATTLLRHYINNSAAPTVPAYYFRSTFTLESGVAAQIESLNATITYDDGAVVYLNGQKVGGLDAVAAWDTANGGYGGSNASDPKTGTISIPGTGLVDGVNTVAVELHNSTTGSSDIYFDLKTLTAVAKSAPADPLPAAPLVSTAATTWSYLDDDTDPSRGNVDDPKVWTTTGFTPTGWKSAKGSFGAKNGTGMVVGPYTANTLLRHYVDGTAAPTVRTYFFRTGFDLTAANVAAIGSLQGEVVYDDAITIYLNGERVAGFLDETVPAETNNQYAGASGGDPVSSTFAIPGSLLRAGTNTLAVSLYQDRATSSDIYLDLKSLTAVAPSNEVAAPSRVILTPTEDTVTQQAVSWLAGNDADSTGELQIEPAAGGTTQTIPATDSGVANGNRKHHFTAVATGLSPATAYRYRVGTPAAYSPWYQFTTADPNGTDFQFVYYGDAQIGLDTTWPAVVSKAAAKAPNSIGSVHAGDLIDTATNENQWLNWFKGMGNSAATTNVLAAPGNHEYVGDNKLAAWKAHFNYPLNQPSTATIGTMADLAVGDTDVARQYAAYFAHWSTFAAETAYTSVYQNTRFITLNATRDTGFLTPANLPACSGATCPSTKVAALWTEFQGRWMDYVLDRSTAKWTVVTFHQPVYSGSTGRNEPVLRQYWVPIFEEHDVDLVAMGHDHVYVRGFNNADTTADAGITDGPVYAVSNSGAKYYDLETDPAKDVWVNNGATRVKAGGNVTTYQVIDVTKNSLTYRSWVGAVNGTSSSLPAVDSLFDSFKVTKTDTGRKWVTETGVDIPVTIDEQPAPTVTATAGNAAQFGVTASAGPDAVLGYQWQSAPSGSDTWTDVAGATARTLTVPAVTTAMNGTRYRAVATNASRSTTSQPSTLAVAVDYSTIRINEVVSSGGTPGDWVELKNIGTAAVDVGGLRFRDNTPSNNYAIPAGTTIPAGGYYVLEEAAFGFGLGSADEANLFQADGTTVVDSYAWTAHRIPSYGRCADGTGAIVLNSTTSKGATNICPSPYANVRINEVESSGGTPGDWVELKNTGTGPVDVGGTVFRDNVDADTYVIPTGTTIAAGGYLVLDEAQFVFGLGSSDSARLFAPDGTTPIDSYVWTAHATTTYGRCPDGTGSFTTTAASTKGMTNSCGTPITDYSTIKVNEVESNGGSPGDWIELKNTGTSPVDVSGIRFRDNDTTHVQYAVPAGTTIAAGGYYVLEEAQFGFGLGAADSAIVWRPDGTTVIDRYDWTAHAVVTYGRCPDGTGPFVDTSSSTKGAVNDCRAPIKINEVESNGGSPGDWVELINTSNAAVAVGGYVFKDNDDTHSYVVPAGTSVPAGGYYVLEEAQFVFGLGQPDSARLFAADGTTLIDSYAWTTHATTTYGRCPNGTGDFATTQVSTKSTANNCAGDLVTSPWPGGQSVVTVDPQGTFASNLSGLMYEPTGTMAPGSIWAVRNGPGALFKLAKTQTGYAPAADFATAGKLLHYPDGTGDVDAEAVTFTSAGSGAGIFVASERNNAISGVSRPAILRYDPTAPGSELSATNDWNLTADLPGLGANLGLEAISWVPDSYLTARGFRDQNTNAAYTPSTYANHGTGLFLVGVEQTGMVYAYALDLTSNAYTRVASFASGFVSVMELYFEPETQQLWVVCDDGCQGRSSRFDVNASGVFAPTAYYERPTGMANLNNEGFTLAPQLECVDGRKPAFWSDDSSTGGFALRQGTVACTVAAPVNQVPPSITGTVAVGSTVTADPGTWNPSDVTFAYQWFANNVAISGATARSFVVTAAQDGQFLSVRVIGTRAGSAPVTAVSASRRVSTMPIANTDAPVITGTAAVGATLTLSTGTWNYPDLSFTYVWYSNGVAIRGATRSTYVVPASMAGRTITGRVTASRPGSDAVVATSSNAITPS